MTRRVSNNSLVSSMLVLPALAATNTARALVRTRAITVAILALLGLSLIACGGSSSKSTPVTPPTVAVTTNVSTATIAAGGAQTFTATVTPAAVSQAVTWSVQEANGGTITQAGVYTAPSTAGTYHVLATSQADTTKVATITITVTAVVVTAPNPVFTSTPSTTLAEGTPTYTYSITATVSDGSAISYTLTTGPTGAAITGSALSWTAGAPNAAARQMPSSFTVTAKTTNGGSATQSWTVTPLRIVTMTLSDLFWASNGATPAPLAGTTPVAAIVPGSPATTIAAKDNGDGTYTMDSVPAGYYWLEDGPTEKYWTNVNSFDASTDYIGQALSAPTTPQAVTITALPLEATAPPNVDFSSDVIWIGSPQTTAWYAPQGTTSPLPTAGVSMTYTGSIAPGTMPAINSGLTNDPSYILQFSPASISGGSGTVGYVGMSIAADASLGTTFTYASPIGATDTLADTTPQTLKFTTTNWGKLTSAVTGGTYVPRLVYFGTYLASLPYITSGLSAIGGGYPSCSGSTSAANTTACTEVAGLAGWPAYASTAPDSAILGFPHEQNTREAGTDAGPLLMAYTALDATSCSVGPTTGCTPPDGDTVSIPVDNAFGSTPMVLSSQVEIQVPLSASVSNFSTISTSQFSVANLTSTIVDQPVIYPVTAPLINTHDLFTSTTLAAPLTLSWTASALNPAITGGKISGYHVLVYAVPASGNFGATLADMGTTNTSLTVPTLGLAAGTYVFVIQANADALASPTANPWHSKFPRGTAQLVSAPITITGAW